MFKDFLIWKPPGGMKIKAKDYLINPPPPKGIKPISEPYKKPEVPDKYKHIKTTMGHIRKEAATYAPLRREPVAARP